ncbi:MAG: hypothetical protein J6V65_03355 [Fibrobacterales bacterium]|nr:hypothetical protein [Fibrobacterales bacterium]
MRAHLVQTTFPLEGKAAAFAQVRALLEEAAPAPGDLVVLPELFACGFTPAAREMAEGDGKLEETAEFLAETARTWKCTVQGTGIGRGKEGRLQNLVSVHGPDGRTIGTFEKIHPFRFGGEEEVFGAGDRILLYEWGDFTVCPMVCYDLRFPECFRLATRLGAQLFAIGANWPKTRREHWRALLQARAIDDLAYVLGANCTGTDGHLVYKGESQAYGPKGEPLGALEDKPGVLTVEPEIRRVLSWREKSMILDCVRDPESLRVVRA